MSRIFLSYRRDDAAGYAGRLRDHLSVRLGADRVFRDFEDLEPGSDWRSQLRQEVAASDVVVVLIGPRWLDAYNTDGKSRLTDPADVHREEILVALGSGALVVPALVQGAAMPPRHELPAELRRLVEFHALTLGEHSWNADVQRFANFLARKLGWRVSRTESDTWVAAMRRRFTNALALLVGWGISTATTATAVVAVVVISVLVPVYITVAKPDAPVAPLEGAWVVSALEVTDAKGNVQPAKDISRFLWDLRPAECDEDDCAYRVEGSDGPFMLRPTGNGTLHATLPASEPLRCINNATLREVDGEWYESVISYNVEPSREGRDIVSLSVMRVEQWGPAPGLPPCSGWPTGHIAWDGTAERHVTDRTATGL